MARLGLAVAGAAIGFAIGGPAGAGIGFSIGAFIGGLLFRETQVIEGPRLQDLNAQQATYGSPIPIPYGTDRIAGTILWVKGNKIDEVKSEEEVSGKGAPAAVIISYEYFVTCAVLICEGPIQGVRKVWADTKLVYNISAEQLSAQLAAGGAINAPIGSVDPLRAFFSKSVANGARIYFGTEGQEPDSLIQAEKGVANTPAYRGIAYIVFNNVPLKDFANRIPNFSFEYVNNNSEQFLFKTPVSIWEPRDNLQVSPDRLFIYMAPARVMARLNAISLQADWSHSFDGQPLPAGGSVINSASFNEVDGFNNGYSNSNGDVGGTYMLIRWDTATGTVNGQFGKPGAGQVINGDILNGTFLIREFIGDVGVRRRWFLNRASGKFNLVNLDLFTSAGTLAAASISHGGENLGPVEITPGTANGGSDEIWLYSMAGGTLRRFEIRFGGVAPFTHTMRFVSETTLSFDKTGTGGGMYYDNNEGLIYMNGADKITGNPGFYSFDPLTNTESLIVDLTTLGFDQNNVGQKPFSAGPIGGKIWAVVKGNPRTFGEVDLRNGAVLRTYLYTNWTSTSTFFDDFYFEPYNNAFLIQATFQTYAFFLPRIDPLDINLSDIIDDVSDRVGLAADEYDTSIVLDTLRGYTITRPTTGRRSLEKLLQGFLVDVAEADSKVKFIPRGSASSVTVLEADLGAGENKAQEENLEEQRVQEIELPERLNFEYSSYESAYDANIQHAKRPSEAVGTSDEMAFSMPAVLSNNLAKQLVEKLFFSKWVERTVLSFSLSRKYLRTIPTDVVSLVRGNASFEARVLEITHGAVLKIKAVSADQESFISDATGANTTITDQILQLTSPTRLFLIDSTMIRDEENDQGFYYAVTQEILGLWNGTQVFKSDDDIVFDPWASLGNQIVGWGVAATALPDGITTVFDNLNTLTVNMARGTPNSDTEINVLNLANACLLKSGDEWELVQWKDATLVSGDTYDLTKLLRGRRGTEHLTSNHQVGDLFLMVTTAGFRRAVEAAEVGLERFYKAITFGKLFDPGGALAFTNLAKGTRPYSVAHVDGTRQLNGNIDLTWIRRTRSGGYLNWNDGITTVPVSEDAESYEIDVIDPVGSPTVTRTLTSTTPSVTYALADQDVDFGSPNPTSIQFNIYQMSVTFGRGVVSTITV